MQCRRAFVVELKYQLSTCNAMSYLIEVHVLKVVWYWLVVKSIAVLGANKIAVSLVLVKNAALVALVFVPVVEGILWFSDVSVSAASGDVVSAVVSGGKVVSLEPVVVQEARQCNTLSVQSAEEVFGGNSDILSVSEGLVSESGSALLQSQVQVVSEGKFDDSLRYVQAYKAVTSTVVLAAMATRKHQDYLRRKLTQHLLMQATRKNAGIYNVSYNHGLVLRELKQAGGLSNVSRVYFYNTPMVHSEEHAESFVNESCDGGNSYLERVRDWHM